MMADIYPTSQQPRLGMAAPAVKLTIKATSPNSARVHVHYGAADEDEDAATRLGREIVAEAVAEVLEIIANEEQIIERSSTTFAAIAEAAGAATAAAATVSGLVDNQVARELVERVEELERAAAATREQAELKATELVTAKQEAEQAQAEWERASKIVSRVAHHKGMTTHVDSQWSKAQLATDVAIREAADAAVVAAAAAAKADHEAEQLARAAPWSDGFVVVAEIGWAAFGEGSYVVSRYLREREAMAAAQQLWFCWIVYKESGTAYHELARGGVGFAHAAIRKYVETKMHAVKVAAREATHGKAPVDEAAMREATSTALWATRQKAHAKTPMLPLPDLDRRTGVPEDGDELVCE